MKRLWLPKVKHVVLKLSLAHVQRCSFESLWKFTVPQTWCFEVSSVAQENAKVKSLSPFLIIGYILTVHDTGFLYVLTND